MVNGFSEGFHISSFNINHNDNDKNSKSASLKPEIIREKIQKEVDLGRFSGPFVIPPYDKYIISPLGIREKKTPGEYRVIHNLSYPYDETSVNATIPRDCATVQYATISDAIRYINFHGHGCFLAKTDIKSAFRLLPIHPDDRHLLGLKWNGLYYFDNCLPMGCASSCKLFELFSTSLEWIVLQRLNNVSVIHVLDDFLFIAPTRDLCEVALSIFLKICEDIGVPIAEEKTMGPSQVLPFVGIELDTIEMVARLPDDKIVKFNNLIEEVLSSKSIKLHQLQSLCGMLNFASGIITPARAFNRRLYDLGIGLEKSYYRIKVTKEVKQDLLVWQKFLHNYNSKTFLLDYIWLTNDHLQLYTDASSTIGFGGVFGSKWFYGLWHPDCLRLNIALLEYYPICLALHLWGPVLANKCITINSDNMAVVYIINSCTSKDKTIMKLVRRFVYLAMHYNILIRAKHLPGILNSCCDFLSRDQVPKALAINKQLEQHPTNIPRQWNLQMWLDS